MKKKLTILMFTLLLAVGWTVDASAQLLRQGSLKSDATHPNFAKQVKRNVSSDSKSIRELIEAPVAVTAAPSKNDSHVGDIELPSEDPAAAMHLAPMRATYTETADAVHNYAWYDGITYQWVDGNNGTHTSKITEPATNPYQMAYLVGSTYVNPYLPGIKYSAFYNVDHPYFNIQFGYDIPTNSRWGQITQHTYSDITIETPTTYNYIDSVAVIADGVVLETWGSKSCGYVQGSEYSTAVLPAGWSTNKDFRYYDADPTYGCYFYGGGILTIPGSILTGKESVRVYVHTMTTYAWSYYWVTINGTRYEYDEGGYDFYDISANISPNNLSGTTVTPPYENGYTVFLVKVKDGTAAQASYDAPDAFTYSWNDVVNYYNTYFDAVELLTDGVRVGGTSSTNAGTVFTYTGSLNRFFFIGKGKNCYQASQGSSMESSSNANRDMAPFYGMYEEFSPTSKEQGVEITDFFERMDQGEAYGVVHDCRGVNLQGHFFSMTGKSGTTHNTLSNLIFYIPDDRGQRYISGNDATWRNYDHEPRVGLYTAELTAKAKPAADYSSSNRVYDVTCDWSTTLDYILGFDEPETYDLWVVVRDEQGNIVLEELLTTTTNTTYTYQVPQYPESYTIDYMVRAWPSSAEEPVDHTANSTGRFFADTNDDDVLIPGYNEFIALHGDHYESDFDINQEKNYYRNFMTLANQNEANGLTVSRIDRGENIFHLYRYDYDKHTSETEAATLTFTHTDNLVNWEVAYLNQDIYTGHTPSNKYQLSVMQIPTTGSFVVSSGGSSSGETTYDTTYVAMDSISFYPDATSSTGNFTVNYGNWSSPTRAMYMNSNGSAYIRANSWNYYLRYTVPAGYSNSTIAFVFGVAANTGSGYLAAEVNSNGGLDAIIQTSTANQYYAMWIEGVSTGDHIDFYGVTQGSNGWSNSTSPYLYDVYLYKEVLTEIQGVDVDDLIDVSKIQFVDQFSASTAEDKHPYNYGYRFQYTGLNTAEWDTTKVSNIYVVPVKHSGSTLNGFYTFEEMIHDSIPELLPVDIKNGDLTMTLKGDPEIFYYTIGRKPDDANAYTRMSYMQFDNNHTFYTEGLNYLPQYTGQTAYPGDMIERYDDAEVLTGDYNEYINYGPVVWTYGYDRFYFDAEGLPTGLTADGIHNSYGAPVWKTGVGEVNVSTIQVQRQDLNSTGAANPTTTWTDDNNQECRLYFLGVDALGKLPTTNMKGEGGTNYYEPYLFRVWVKSKSGKLRGYTPIAADVANNVGDHMIYNANYDHYQQVVYEEYTNSTQLQKLIPETYTNSRNIIKFGALTSLKDTPSDMEVIVRFYYKVKHLDPVDDSADNIAIFDFTLNDIWQIPAGSTSNWQTSSGNYGEGDNIVTLANKYYYDNVGSFVMLGADGTLTLPAFDRKVKQIQVIGRPGASSSVKENIFVGNTAVSTEATGSTGTNIFDINEDYQAIGTVYTLKVTNNYNAQITKVIVIFEEEEQPAGMHAPKRVSRENYTLVSDAVDGSKFSESTTISLSAPWTATDVYNQSGQVLYIRSGGSLVFTVPSGYSNATFKFVPHTSTSYYNGTFKFTPSSGTAQTLTTSAANTEYEQVMTGLSAGQTVTITGTCGNYSYSPDFTYLYVYVQDQGGSTPTTGNVTVCDGNGILPALPFFGSYHDESQHDQMIYPASRIDQSLSGKTIKSMTFYPTTGTNNGYTYSGINFYNGSVTFKLANLTAGQPGAFDSSNPQFVTANMTQVKTVTMPTSAQTSLTAWVIEFDTPFTYTGGDLLVDVTNTIGDWGNTYFAGTQISGSYPGYISYSSGGGTVDYLPKVTFTYENASTPTPVLNAPTNGSTVNVGTNTGSGVSVPVTISGSDLTQDLTISVSGTGFSVSPTTVTAAAANAGTSVTVTYSGTNTNAAGTLIISSGEVSATVTLTATYDAGSTPNDPVLITPLSGSTVFVGTITTEGESVSMPIGISGNYLTKDLTATVTGAGFSLLTRDVTVPYADVNAGTASVTVVYNGTAENATGRLNLSSDEVSAYVLLTASYREPVVLTNTPAGYVVEDSETPTQIFTGIIETLYEIFHGEVVDVIYYNTLGMQSKTPFDGINIIVTRYSDGTTTTSKVVR